MGKHTDRRAPDYDLGKSATRGLLGLASIREPKHAAQPREVKAPAPKSARSHVGNQQRA